MIEEERARLQVGQQVEKRRAGPLNLPVQGVVITVCFPEPNVYFTETNGVIVEFADGRKEWCYAHDLRRMD